MRWILPLLAAFAASSFAAETSALWGKHGEAWTPTSRLPDFSHAGYHQGERALPVLPKGLSVMDFGAKGDGIADDTAAFQDALNKAPAGAIEVPQGRYRITKMLVINRSGIVLSGAGPEESVLVCPVPLETIQPSPSATTTGRPTSRWSWDGGIVSIKGDYRAKQLTRITAEAHRGDTLLTVEKTEGLKPGQRVIVRQHDLPDNSLAAHLYSGDPGPMEKLLGSTKTLFVCTVTKIDGRKVSIDRPLRCDLKPQWKAEIASFQPTVTESGVEGLTFEFPVTPYEGHFTEAGYNALAFNGCSDCWARNLRIVNADSGIFARGVFCTIADVTFESKRQPDKTGCTGHHGFAFYGHDNLMRGFDFRTRFIHDISVDGGASGNVAAEGKGVDLCLDHHKRTCFENLFTNLDAGAGTRLWAHGGGDALGKPCAARGTFWNIRAAKPLAYPPADFGPLSINVVALSTDQPSETSPDGKWFEATQPAALEPQDLHADQLARRLGK
ncbi:MAG: glycosyl hydrolase family 28-related protein [Chthoniobacteraceae bacterium]